MNDQFDRLPQFIIGEGDKSRSVLITAGMDGDEYASIDAAYRIIEELKKGKLNGRVIVFPIVNLKGFKTIASINPIDNKYPKQVFPGDKSGSDTEKLIYFLYQKYIRNCSVWIDLHGGAITEYLEPYFYAFETRDGDNIFSQKVVSSLESDKVVYGLPGWWNKTEILGKMDVNYFLMESGYSGRRDLKYITKHIDWVKNILAIKGMIEYGYEPYSKKRIYRDAYEFIPEISGLWFPRGTKNLMVNKGQVIGEIRSYDNKLLQEVTSPYEGEIMWITRGMLCEKGAPLFEIGINSMNCEELRQ